MLISTRDLCTSTRAPEVQTKLSGMSNDHDSCLRPLEALTLECLPVVSSLAAAFCSLNVITMYTHSQEFITVAEFEELAGFW